MATDEDLDYIDSRHPNYQSAPTGPNSTQAHDVYQARLKVLAGLHPKTIALMRQASATTDPAQRRNIELQAVQSYRAELAQFWTEEEVLAWQRNNPSGTEWICEFVHVLEKPMRKIDPVDYELALNWLRLKYNMRSSAELDDAIWEATKVRLGPDLIKKRRQRLELTSERPPGPTPKSEQ